MEGFADKLEMIVRTAYQERLNGEIENRAYTPGAFQIVVGPTSYTPKPGRVYRSGKDVFAMIDRAWLAVGEKITSIETPKFAHPTDRADLLLKLLSFAPLGSKKISYRFDFTNSRRGWCFSVRHGKFIQMGMDEYHCLKTVLDQALAAQSII